MKKSVITFFFIAVFSIFNMMAEDAVSMVSFEQSFLDTDATIALKNNTTEHIRQVSFTIDYLDMDGTPMDYVSFTRRVDIAPGRTKKIDIPSYESSRYYYYFKSKNPYDMPNSKSFKVKYELTGYNGKELTVPVNEALSTPEPDRTSDVSSGCDNETGALASASLIMLVVLFIVFGIYVGMYVLVAVMAQRRRRNPALWLILSFLATPLLVCLLLLIVGKADAYNEC